MANYEVTHFDGIEPVACPCGFARRAFAHRGNQTATMHVVDIQADAKAHYYKAHPGPNRIGYVPIKPSEFRSSQTACSHHRLSFSQGRTGGGTGRRTIRLLPAGSHGCRVPRCGPCR